MIADHPRGTISPDGSMRISRLRAQFTNQTQNDVLRGNRKLGNPNGVANETVLTMAARIRRYIGDKYKMASVPAPNAPGDIAFAPMDNAVRMLFSAFKESS